MKLSAVTGCVSFTVAALVACGQGPVHSTGEQRELALEQITAARLKAHVEYLADDARQGREAGEPGYDDAAAYVVEQLAAMGVTAAGEDGWYQRVALRQYKIDTDSARASILRDGEESELSYRDDFAMVADAVRTETSLCAEVAYVGFGVHAPEHGYSDYDGIDVRGKIVASFRGAPEIIAGDARAHFGSSRVKSREAVARGAVGSISLRSRKSEERRPWDEIKKRFGRRPATAWVDDDGGAASYFPEMEARVWLSIESAERLFALSPLSFEEAHAASLGDVPRSALLSASLCVSGRTQHSTMSSPNVIGMVRGSDPVLANEYVIYSAHLDHIGVVNDDEEGDKINNGMYDNAMGVALMLETARALATAPPRRSVLFIALTAEESGLLGSNYFVNNPTVPIDALVANINLDMPLFLHPIADLVAFGSQHSSLQSVAESAAAAEGFLLSPDPIPDESLFVRSDQYSFVQKGIPAVFLVAGFNSNDPDVDGEALYEDHAKNHYHEPSDDLSRPVHWGSAVRFARAHTRMGQLIANDPARPTWNEGDFFGEHFRRGK